MNRYKLSLAVIGAGEWGFTSLKKAKEMNVQTLAFGHIDSLLGEFIDYFL